MWRKRRLKIRMALATITASMVVAGIVRFRAGIVPLSKKNTRGSKNIKPRMIAIMMSGVDIFIVLLL